MADQEFASVTNIVLVGRTENGESFTGNSLQSEKLFLSKEDGVVTMLCKMYGATRQDGPIIYVIGTSGLLDLYVSSDYINEKIINGLTLPGEGIYSNIKVENDKLNANVEEIESKYLAEAELIAMKEKSQMEHEYTLTKVELRLKHNAETHENEMHHYVIHVSDVSADNKVFNKRSTT